MDELDRKINARGIVEEFVSECLEAERRERERAEKAEADLAAVRAENARLLAERSNGRVTEQQILQVMKWADTADAALPKGEC